MVCSYLETWCCPGVEDEENGLTSVKPLVNKPSPLTPRKMGKGTKRGPPPSSEEPVEEELVVDVVQANDSVLQDWSDPISNTVALTPDAERRDPARSHTRNARQPDDVDAEVTIDHVVATQTPKMMEKSVVPLREQDKSEEEFRTSQDQVSDSSVNSTISDRRLMPTDKTDGQAKHVRQDGTDDESDNGLQNPVQPRSTSSAIDEEEEDRIEDIDGESVNPLKESGQSSSPSLSFDYQKDGAGYPSIDRRVLPKKRIEPSWRVYLSLDPKMIAQNIALHEPLSFLQRMAEMMEFCDLLNKANESRDPAQRLAFVTAFAVSGMSLRRTKPFDPFPGETYELVTKDCRFVAEQVGVQYEVRRMNFDASKVWFANSIREVLCIAKPNRPLSYYNTKLAMRLNGDAIPRWFPTAALNSH